MRDNRIIQQLVAENSATVRKKVAEHSVTTEIERINSSKEKLGRAQTTQKGQLAIVGPTQKFFPDYQLAEMTTWIIDQLTLGSAKVEIWEATKSPFRDDLTKVRMIKTY
jgi:hypothetical protein